MQVNVAIGQFTAMEALWPPSFDLIKSDSHLLAFLPHTHGSTLTLSIYPVGHVLETISHLCLKKPFDLSSFQIPTPDIDPTFSIDDKSCEARCSLISVHGK